MREGGSGQRELMNITAKHEQQKAMKLILTIIGYSPNIKDFQEFVSHLQYTVPLYLCLPGSEVMIHCRSQLLLGNTK